MSGHFDNGDGKMHQNAYCQQDFDAQHNAEGAVERMVQCWQITVVHHNDAADEKGDDDNRHHADGTMGHGTFDFAARFARNAAGVQNGENQHFEKYAADNIFVFLMIFGYFKVEPKFQHRVLLYGVFGAIVLRAIMIFIGAALVQQFEWILYLFGAFLLYTGIHMMKPEAEAEEDLSQNKILTLLKKVIPTSQQFDDEKFFTIENGKRIATPLLLVLIMIELSDVIFAVDSIPAIFAVTTDPFIVLTSNIFAILGLRAMYFLLADFAERFIFLKYGLAFVLSFIGIKMLIMHWVHIPISISLSVVFGALGASILTSLVYTRQQEKK